STVLIGWLQPCTLSSGREQPVHGLRRETLPRGGGIRLRRLRNPLLGQQPTGNASGRVHDQRGNLLQRHPRIPHQRDTSQRCLRATHRRRNTPNSGTTLVVLERQTVTPANAVELLMQRTEVSDRVPGQSL